MLLTQRFKHIISNDPNFLFDLKLKFYFKILGFSKFYQDIYENIMKIPWKNIFPCLAKYRTQIRAGAHVGNLDDTITKEDIWQEQAWTMDR